MEAWLCPLASPYCRAAPLLVTVSMAPGGSGMWPGHSCSLLRRREVETDSGDKNFLMSHVIEPRLVSSLYLGMKFWAFLKPSFSVLLRQN